MPPAATRSLKITYGSTVVGGTTTYLIDGPVRFSKSYERFDLAFRVVVQDSTAATFQSACAALEAAFRTPRQLIKVEMEGQTFIDLNPSSNTGFLAEPTISDGADTPAATGRSRVYDITIACQLPADLSGQSGRADSTVTVDYDASRRLRITITGRYTALSSNSASAQYNAAIGTYSSSILSSWGGGGTFDIISEYVVPDDADKNCSFSRVYQEVLYAPTSGGLSHASIRGASIVYSRRRPAPGDSPDKPVRRLEEVTVQFTCSVNNDVSTSLETLYNDSVRPYLLSQAASLFNASATAVVDETRNFDKSGNTIAATLDLRMVVNGALHIEYARTVAVDDEKGETLQPAWDGASRYAKYRFPGIARRTRTITSVERVIGLWSVTPDGSGFVGGGGAPVGAGAGGGGAGKGAKAAASSKKPSSKAAAGSSGSAGSSAGSVGAQPLGGEGWVTMRTRRAAKQVLLGIDAQVINATDCETIIDEEYYVTPSGGGGAPTTTSDPSVRGPFRAPGGAVTTS